VQNNANSLTTQTLTTSNLENSAEYEAEGYAATIGGGLQGGLPQLSGAGIGEDHGDANSTTLSGISGGTVNVTDNTQQTTLTGNDATTTVALLNRDVHVNEHGEAVDNQGNSTANTITPIFDAEKVANEINAQVQITQAFSQQAHQAVGDYVQNQRQDLQNQLKNAETTEERLAIQSQLSELRLEEQVMNVLIGAVTGFGGAALSKEVLSAAADQMQQLMIEDSRKFAGVVDKDGNPLFSNLSGDSDGINGSGQKIAGTRADLDLLCGPDNSRCKFEKNPDGSIDTSKPVTFTGDYQEFLKTEDGQKMLSAPFGGLQGGERTWLFGMPYEKGGWVDNLLEAFAGPHDMIGGRVSGLYDEQGNTTRGRTNTTKMAHEVWSGVALMPAAPFAAAQGLPSEVWQAISIFLKAGQ
jgi:filamentous hemagglutinin